MLEPINENGPSFGKEVSIPLVMGICRVVVSGLKVCDLIGIQVLT